MKAIPEGGWQFSRWAGGLLSSWDTACAFGGLWVVYPETRGRGSRTISAGSVLSQDLGPQICFSWS